APVRRLGRRVQALALPHLVEVAACRAGTAVAAGTVRAGADLRPAPTDPWSARTAGCSGTTLGAGPHGPLPLHLAGPVRDPGGSADVGLAAGRARLAAAAGGAGRKVQRFARPSPACQRRHVVLPRVPALVDRRKRRGAPAFPLDRAAPRGDPFRLALAALHPAAGAVPADAVVRAGTGTGVRCGGAADAGADLH